MKRSEGSRPRGTLEIFLEERDWRALVGRLAEGETCSGVGEGSDAVRACQQLVASCLTPAGLSQPKPASDDPSGPTHCLLFQACLAHNVPSLVSKHPMRSKPDGAGFTLAARPRSPARRGRAWLKPTVMLILVPGLRHHAPAKKQTELLLYPLRERDKQ
jgi:hypothetical protein